MTQTSRATNQVVMLLDAPAILDAAAEDPTGRIAIRTPQGLVSFFPVGDLLEGRATPAQADYLAKIEGYTRDGEEARPPYQAPVRDWIEQGRRDFEGRAKGSSDHAPTDMLSALVAALGGPEMVIAKLLQGQMGDLTQKAVALKTEENVAAEALKQQKLSAEGWTFAKLTGKLDTDTVFGLLNEFDPGYPLEGRNIKAAESRLVKLAADNLLLNDRLYELTTA